MPTPLPTPPPVPQQPPATGLTEPAIVITLRAAGCVFAEDEARLLVAAARTPGELAAMVASRAGGLPLEQVVGWAEFCGLRIAVEPGVFVPRHRTELLVQHAVDLAARHATEGGGPLVIVDLCCGSGALGAAVADALRGRDLDLHAADIDPAAVRCARRNVAAAGGRVYEGDLYAPLPGALAGRVDLLIANAPYVPTGAIGLLPPEARLYEPLVALDGGLDGLDILRRVIAGAPDWLAPGGHLLVETSQRQAPLALDAVARSGLAGRVAGSDNPEAAAVIATRSRS